MFNRNYEIILIDIKQMTHKDKDRNDVRNEIYDGEEVARYHDFTVPFVGDVIHNEGISYIVQERHHSADCPGRKVILVEELRDSEQNEVVDDKLVNL